MNYFLTFLGSAVVFLGLDSIWIKFVAKPELDKIAGEYMKAPNILAAVLFYIIYLSGILIFAVKFSDSIKHAGMIGLGLGVLAYATYEFTNMSTLSGWSWKMVALDTAWGGILTSITCMVGYIIWAKFK